MKKNDKPNPTVDPSHVAVLVCPICGDDTGVVLSTTIEDGKLTTPFDKMRYVDPSMVCPTCREKYLKEGILLINPKTCSLAVLKVDAYMRMFPNQVITDDHIVFADEEQIEMLVKLGAIQNGSSN